MLGNKNNLIRRNIMETKRKVAFWIAGIIILLNAAILAFGACLGHLFAIAGLGMVTFIGVLMLTNYLSESTAFDKGEMRKAITASVVVVFFALIALFSMPTKPIKEEIAKQSLEHIAYLVGILIAFYFVSRSVDSFIKAKKS